MGAEADADTDADADMDADAKRADILGADRPMRLYERCV